jgi:hypothetical protein
MIKLNFSITAEMNRCHVSPVFTMQSSCITLFQLVIIHKIPSEPTNDKSFANMSIPKYYIPGDYIVFLLLFWGCDNNRQHHCSTPEILCLQQ